MTQLQGASRFDRRAIKVEEALRLVLEAAAPGRSESVPLGAAAGRRLAEAVTASCDWPPFARSGLDGYALRSADTAHASPEAPALLCVVGMIAAGDEAAEGAHASGREALAGEVGEPAQAGERGAAGTAPSAGIAAAAGAGCAVRIMTGGAVPDWADAVVMLEQTADALQDGQPAVRVKRAAEPGQNIARPGEEFRRGSVLAGPGTLLRPGHIALLGTFGYADVPVFARPRVAVLATGGELLPVAAPLAPGKIRDSNSSMVAALAEQSGALALPLGRVADDPDAVVRALAAAFEQADMVITTGGVSVGDLDVMAAILRGMRGGGQAASSAGDPEIIDTGISGMANAGAGGPSDRGMANTGAEGSSGGAPANARAGGISGGSPAGRLLFDKVAMRPGSPTSAAVVGGKLLLALSGNPGACFVGFELFARPALLRLQGADEAASRPQTITARLAADFSKGSPHERYVRTRLDVRDGIVYAEPLAFGKSSMMASIPEADGLLRLPAGPRGAERGALVEVLLVGPRA